MKKNFKNFLDLSFILFTFPYNVLIVIFNLNKIVKSDVIINFNAGGFGHQFVLTDLSRYVLKNKKVLFINFLQKKRHNKYLCSLFNISHFNIFSSLTFSFFSKSFIIGETESSDIKINFFLIKLLISLFEKDFFSTVSFYEFVIFKYKNLKNINRVCYWLDQPDRHIDIYFNFLLNKKLRINHSTQVQKKIYHFSEKLFKKKKKIFILYIRLKFGSFDSAIRSASKNFNHYNKIIDFLIKRNYFIIITGDIKNFNLKKKFSNDVFTYKNFTSNKDLFEAYVSLKSDLYISDGLGGGTFYGIYSKKAIGLNFFPKHNWYIYSNILYKDVLIRRKVVNTNNIKMRKVKNKNFNVRRKSVTKILNFLRNNIQIQI